MKKILCITLALGLAVAGCSSDDPSTPNSAPVITAGPGAVATTIASSETTIVSVTATDSDGDDLSYDWSCADGTFSGSGELVVYQPGAVTAQAVHTIQVTVSDGKGGSDTGTVDVTVNPTVVVGATYRVRLNSLTFVEASCDGFLDDDLEAYWNIQAGSVSAVRASSNFVTVHSGDVVPITTGWAEADVLFDGTGAIVISGTVTDEDTSSGDDLVGSWNLSYNTGNIAVGTFNVSGGNPVAEGCTVVLNFTVEMVGDVYGAP